MIEPGVALVRVALLGPVHVRALGGWVPVAGVKLQALLALLGLSIPRPVSSDRLVEELWGDAPPRNPANALQAQVSALRRVLGTDTVVRDGSGYRLALAPDEVDTERFERLARAGRDAAAVGKHDVASDAYREAGALVTGTPLEGLLDFAFARDAASRLEQLVISVHEGFVDAELAQGHHADVVHTLTELVAAHPLWERFHAQLILALFRCGRQSDALRAYQHVRTLLAEEMGLDPGPELQALERAVLSHDPALAAPVPVAPFRPAVSAPVPLTAFIGRGDELAALADAHAASRLVTVVGPGGAGKTRLVLATTESFALHVEWWFVDLAAVVDERAVGDAVATAIGASDRAPVGAVARLSAEDRIVERLGHRRVVLVVDNCEQVVRAVARLAELLLAECPGLSIIATSRESLGVDGEHLVPVSAMTDGDATALFAACARAVSPSAGADTATWLDDVAALCRHLDGLPLAIELAAARTKTIPVSEITARLDERFRLLVAPKRAEGTRQHGLRTAIDWSYDLLTGEEQRVFRAFAVFAGGADSLGATAVSGGDAPDVLDRLVDKSLVIADTSGRVTRYRMLESLRAYALDRLTESGEREAVVAAHRAWCIALADAAEAGIRRPDQLVWLARLDAEHDNLQAALTEAIAHDPDRGLRLIGPLLLPWWFRSRGRAARWWAEAALAAGDTAEVDDVDHAAASALAKTLTWIGLLADFGERSSEPGGFARELELAEVRQRRALTRQLETGDDVAVAYTRAFLALTLTRRALAGLPRDGDELDALVASAVEAFVALDDAFGLGMVRTVEAVSALVGGDPDHSHRAADAAFDAAVRSGDHFVRGRVEWIRGLLARAVGDADRAYRHIERGLLFLDELGMGQEVTVQAALLVDLAEQRGRASLAEQWRTFVVARGGGLARHDILLLASTRNREAIQARRVGDLARSRAAHLAARDAYVEADVSAAIAFTESCLGFVASVMGDRDEAVVRHVAALAAAVDAHDPASLALALEGLASVTSDEVAAVLVGGASGLRSEASLDPADVSHRDDVMAVEARVRHALGDAGFSSAYDRGGTMSAGDLVALARSGIR